MINSKSIYFAFILLVASSLFWSGNFFTGKVASLYNLTPFKLSFLRWSLAFLLLLPFTYRKIIEDFDKYKKKFYFFNNYIYTRCYYIQFIYLFIFRNINGDKFIDNGFYNAFVNNLFFMGNIQNSNVFHAIFWYYIVNHRGSTHYIKSKY